jgi:methyl-accepting chemotaxis protein
VKSRHSLTIATVLGFIALLSIGFTVQQRVTTTAFDKLEARQVSEHAERVRVALEYETQLLRNYGATNSIWDSSYSDVENADEAAFESDFVPGDLKGIYGLDGVVGVAPDGKVLIGGLAQGDVFQPLPNELTNQAVIKTLFDNNAEAGKGNCGLVNSGAPFVFCGFKAFRSDSTTDNAGALIFFKELDAPGLKAFGNRSGLTISQIASIDAGEKTSESINSEFGKIQVSTQPISANSIGLDMAVPVVNSDKPVIFRVDRDRPIHKQAIKTEEQMAMLIGGIGVSLLIVVVVLQKFVVEARVRKLRRTIDQIQKSNDRNMRVALRGADEIGMLAKSFNEMLATNANQEAEIARNQALQAEAHNKAERLVSDTASSVVGELDTVVNDVDRVSNAAGEIDRRVAQAATMTGQAFERAQDASTVVQALTESTRRIAEITDVITSVADQTNLLALNATIEAARAGQAGKGFAVVAGEVKNLANMTAQSTGDIAASIANIQRDAEAVTAVIADIVTSVEGISATTGEIVGATQEQRETVEALSRQLDGAVGKIRELSTKPAVSAEDRFGAPREFGRV